LFIYALKCCSVTCTVIKYSVGGEYLSFSDLTLLVGIIFYFHLVLSLESLNGFNLKLDFV